MLILYCIFCHLKGDFYLNSANMNKRNIVIMGIMFACALAVSINVFKVSVVDNEYYQEKANKTQFGSMTISANRGSIYSSDGSILAQSATVFKVYIDPKNFKEHDQQNLDITVDFLSETLELDRQSIIDKINKTDTQYQVLKNKVEKPIVDKINTFLDEHNMTSIKTSEDVKRYYPQGELAASVIGFTNYDGEGWYGIEAYYDDELSGVDGKVISAKDAYSQEMPYKYSKLYDAEDGNSLQLTIDTTLQYYLEKNLQDMYNTYQLDNRACGIIMNANTGAILAMATCPGFDLNSPSEITDQRTLNELGLIANEEERSNAEANARELQWKNKAVSEIYIPGSVFKVFTSSAGFEENVLSLDDTFYCSGSLTVAGQPIRCWNRNGHGSQTFKDALTNSCNPAFMEIGKRLGAENFFYYFEAFGLTDKTGIDLPSEISSYYAPEDRLGPVELASSSFGQTNKVTPIEMITAYASVINGGKLLVPYVVDKVIDSDGNTIKTTETTVKRQVISEDTSATMRDCLEYVVNTNGGSNAYIKGYRIGGKSGTSQKLDEYNEANMRYVASYVCFAPADNPEIIMLIMADEPTTGEYYGSVVAVPCARSILEEVLPYLGYYPEYSDEELATLDVTVPSVEDTTLNNAENTLTDLGLTYEVVGHGDMVVSQTPISGSSIAQGGKIILYTEANQEQEFVEVPNLTGYSLTEANSLLSSLNLNYVASGASTEREDATVYSQSYNEGEHVPVGTIIELTFVVKEQGD